MIQKQSLQDALHNSLTYKKHEKEIDLTFDRESKKLIVEIPLDAHLQIDQMKRDLRRHSMKDVVIEALNDLFKKYDYPPIA